MQELLAIIAKGLVDDPDSVKVEADAPAEDGTIVYHIHVAEDDMAELSVSRAELPKLSAQLPVALQFAVNKK